MPHAEQPRCSSHPTPIHLWEGPSRVSEWTGSGGRGSWLRSTGPRLQRVYPQIRCILGDGQLEFRAGMQEAALFGGGASSNWEILNVLCLERPVRDSMERLDDMMKTILHPVYEDSRKDFSPLGKFEMRFSTFSKLGHGGMGRVTGGACWVRLRMMSGEGEGRSKKLLRLEKQSRRGGAR
jgi:hypothetical protein